MFSLPIHKMTLQEKLQAIDAIWNSICQQPVDEISPDWHKKELDNRLEQVTSDQAVFEDWEVVKKELQDFSR